MERCNLSLAILSEGSFDHAYLKDAKLDDALLIETSLTHASLYGATCRGAVFADANLEGAIFTGAYLENAELVGASMGETVLANTGLGRAAHLDRIHHGGPSVVDHRTLAKSGRLPLPFLRGVGLADWQIEEARLLELDLTPGEITDILYRVSELRGTQPLQLRPVFISYSHHDGPFVDALEAELNGVGIRFWRDIHDIEAGPLEQQVHRAMEDRVAVIVLSNASTQSDWVEHEVRHARELAKTQGRYTLCPIALDDSWKRCAWPERLREQVEEFAILDFSGWQERKRMSEMFGKLERGLRKWYR